MAPSRLTFSWARLVRLLFAAAVVCLATACPQAQATPVMFRFEATISNIEGDAASLNLPFSLTIGQQIAGKYSFQSEEELLDIFLHHEQGKRGEISLTIDSIEINAVTNVGTLNDSAFIDPPIPFTASSIVLGFAQSSETDSFMFPGTVAGNPWNHQLDLFGPEGSITSTEQLLDVSVWNELGILRRLDLQFGFPDTISVDTVVGDFSVVPEPCSVWLASVTIMLSLVKSLFGNRKAKRLPLR
jgi:hypothetical protein